MRLFLISPLLTMSPRECPCPQKGSLITSAMTLHQGQSAVGDTVIEAGASFQGASWQRTGVSDGKQAQVGRRPVVRGPGGAVV